MKTLRNVCIIVLIINDFCSAQNLTNLEKRLERRRSYYFKKRQNSEDFTIVNRVPHPVTNLTELKYPVIEKKTIYQTYQDQEIQQSFTEKEPEKTTDSVIANEEISALVKHIENHMENTSLTVNKTTQQAENTTNQLLSDVKTALALNPEKVREFMSKITKFGEACMKETNASGEDVAQLMAHQMPTSHEGKCMMSCVYKNLKLQNEDGTMNHEETLKLVEEMKDDDPELYEKFLTVFNNCKDSSLEVEDPCESAVQVSACAVKEGKKIGLSTEIMGI